MEARGIHKPRFKEKLCFFLDWEFVEGSRDEDNEDCVEEREEEEEEESTSEEEEDYTEDPCFQKDDICDQFQFGFDRTDSEGTDSGIHELNPSEPSGSLTEYISHKGGADLIIHCCENCKSATEIKTTRRRGHKDSVNAISIMSAHVNRAYTGGDGNVSDSSDSSVFFEETWEEVTTVYVNENDRTPVDAAHDKCGLVSVLCKCFNNKEVNDKQSVPSLTSTKSERSGSSLSHHSGLNDYATDFCRGCRTRIFPNLRSSNAAYRGRFTPDDDDVVIVSALRTPICKARKGSFKDTLPDDLLSTVFSAIVESVDLEPSLIEDVCVGNALQPGAGACASRVAQFFSDIPDSVPISAVNRMCSSGLQACGNIAASIKAGYIDIGIAAGMESMTVNPVNCMPHGMVFNPKLMEHDKARQVLTAAGVAAENVADKFGFTREQLDNFAFDSFRKANRAQKAGFFEDEITPVHTKIMDHEGKETNVTVKEDGLREGITFEKLSQMKPVFKESGTSTAGNSSQVADGAAGILMARRSTALKHGLPIMGVFRGFAVTGVPPELAGVGGAIALEKALKKTGLTVDDVDVFEINESFASEVCFCVERLGLPLDKVNPNGGSIALGHPVGCTGARQLTTLIHELKRRGRRANGVVAMGTGMGMGAAAVIEYSGY